MTKVSAVDEIAGQCLAVRVRLIGRAITAIYDGAVQGHGIGVAQLNLLAALGKIGPCSPSALGNVLQLERSTVSRNLESLIDDGWIARVSSDAKGVREIALTTKGREKIEAALVDWRGAQRKAAALLGDDGVQAVRSVAANLMASASG